jgi:hypothetical protein
VRYLRLSLRCISELSANFGDQGRLIATRVLITEVCCRVECTMKKKIQLSEHEYRSRLKSLLKDAFTTELQPLRSMETVTKKRRALKKWDARNSRSAKPGTAASR